MMKMTMTALCLLFSVLVAAGDPSETPSADRAIAGAGACVTAKAPGGSILPPIDCNYISPAKVHQLLEDPNKPNSVKLQLHINHRRFLCMKPRLNGPCKITKGGPLGGQLEEFDSTLVIDITGVDEFKDYKRTLALDAYTITATSQIDPKADYQVIENQMVHIEATLTDDVDFNYLRIVAGTDNGLESSGRTTITRVGEDLYQADSEFEIEYAIDVEASEDGPLRGLAASSKGIVTMHSVAGKKNDNGQ